MRRKTVLLLVGLVLVVSAPVTATSTIFDAQDEETVWSYDKAICEKYSPHVMTPHLDVEPEAAYCGIADRSDSDTTVIAYWYRYPVQNGLFGLDSHLGDREPVYVHVDSNTGAVERVVYSGYHYFASSLDDPNTVNVNGNETHATLHIVRPHHHFAPSGHPAWQGELVDVKPLVDTNNPGASAVQAWYANGWSESVNAKFVANPHLVEGGDNWWAEDTREGRLTARWYGTWQYIDEKTGLDMGGWFSGLF